MSQQDIIRAWKDEEYRSRLSSEEKALLPLHPAGLLELTDEALDALIANGGEPSRSCFAGSCNGNQAVIVDSSI